MTQTVQAIVQGREGLFSLEVRSLGSSEVLKQGQPVHWRAEGARELFFYLLAFPEGRSREQILEDLWQVEANPASTNRLRVTLHRVKKALDDPEGILQSDGRYHLAEHIVAASDLFLFSNAVASAHKQQGSERIAAFELAQESYRGDFLPSLEADWISDTREELRSIHAQTLLELALLHCERHDCQESVDILAQALHTDPYLGENYHQRLMTCLSVVGTKYQAIEHYRRFLHFLQAQLSDTPMLETIQLAERIKNGERVCQRCLLEQSCPKLSGRPKQIPRSN